VLRALHLRHAVIGRLVYHTQSLTLSTVAPYLLPAPLPPPHPRNNPRPSHRAQRRCLQPHAAVPQAARPPRRSPTGPWSFTTPDARREDPVCASRESRRVAAVEHEQWKRYPWPGESQTQAGSGGYAGCVGADGPAAVYELWIGEHGGACEHTLRSHDCCL
jgi:hypothetical protein